MVLSVCRYCVSLNVDARDPSARVKPQSESRETDNAGQESVAVEVNQMLFSKGSKPHPVPPPDTDHSSLGCPCQFPGVAGKVQGSLAVPVALLATFASYVPMVLFRGGYTARVIIEISVFHMLWIPMMVSWVQCVLVNPGTMDRSWELYLSSVLKAPQTCMKSGLLKPPRSHFCAVSERLVLNMDHFCPWISNTVGFHNRKFFLLFLFYTTLTCGFTAAAFAVRIAFCYSDDNSDQECMKAWLIVVCVKDLVLAVLLGNFGMFHWQMACKNETSVELGLNAKLEYDVGKEENLRQVFGEQRQYWAIPLYFNGPSFDGIEWPTRGLSHEETIAQAKATQTKIHVI
eukprot:TRINITY_DN4138_c0_g1_i4.p1 TRINITY_DN4138_c0_g1~~TRINITY_DN4138_c0_g1_i4.p1  ORF type:complete len:344 (+),score=56.48 TRINITY_DN4138_c0_g1_i4:340-1371(+)